MLPITEGCIVDICDEPCVTLRGTQGIVAGIQMCLGGRPDEITVHVPRNLCACMDISSSAINILGESPFGEFTVLPGGALEVVHEPGVLGASLDWTPENAAEIFFRNFYSVTSCIKFERDPSRACMIEGCTGTQERTAWFNCHGAVSNLHVCPQHYREYHGVAGDSVPLRQFLRMAS